MNKPVRNDEGRYLTVKQMMAQSNLCRSKVMKMAEEAGAILRIGRLIRINYEKFFEYTDREYDCQIILFQPLSEGGDVNK